MDAAVLLSRSGSLAMATLNSPKTMNALTLGMVQLLRPLALERDASALLLRGAGGRAFCAGGDVRRIHSLRGNLPSQLEFFREEYLTDFALARHARTCVPHVALWDGVVMGGGVGVSIHAPFRVASERTLFAMPETAIGIFPDVGGSYVLPRLALGPWWGLYLGLTGARVAGADAVHGGLATHFVPEARLGALVEGLAALPAPGSAPYAARAAAVARVLGEHALPPAQLPAFTLPPLAQQALARAFAPEAATLPTILARLRAEAAAGSGGEGVRAAEAALDALRAASPTACSMALEAQRRAAAPSTTLGSALAMELRALAALLGNPHADFYEGIRAVLVDKGKGRPPAWAALPEAGMDASALKAHFEGGNVLEGEAELLALGSHLQ